MFSSTLPLLPPPSTSLLPPLHTSSTEVGQHGSHLHGTTHLQQQRRNKHLHQARSSVHLLTLDERAITQRKMAIAMYGYSWLKPAGCIKTMLGRREEELEREEAERQLREVEMQERAAAEGEAEAEAERLAEMRRLELEAEANGGTHEGQEGERDLDDDIPEAEAQDDEEVESDLEGEDMEGDLDDDIPDADDADVGETSWAYDTSRDPDTESEGNTSRQHGDALRTSQAQTAFIGMEEAAETEAMVNAMLDEDELGELDRRLDMDRDLDMDVDLDMDMEGEIEHDLDDDVPEAESEDEWQHTDTELEESDMDISIASAHAIANANAGQCPPSSGIGPGTTHEEIRRVSGNVAMPPPALPPASTRRQARSEWLRQRTTPQMYRTPDADADPDTSNLISTDGSTRPNEAVATTATDQRSRWLSTTGARRTLFGTRGGGSSSAGSGGSGGGSGFTPDPPRALQTGTTTTAASSGGLFTPSPRVGSNDTAGDVQEPRSRTRSGRLPGGGGRR